MEPMFERSRKESKRSKGSPRSQRVLVDLVRPVEFEPTAQIKKTASRSGEDQGVGTFAVRHGGAVGGEGGDRWDWE